MATPGDPRVVVLAPWRTDNGHRQKLWDFTQKRWAEFHGNWPIYEGAGPTDGPFNRSAAINEAALLAGDWDAAVVIDTDIIPNPDALNNAVELALKTDQLVISHDERVMLSKSGTDKVLRGFTGSWRSPTMVEKVWQDSVSCAVVVSRKLWDLVGGFDEMFVGWGREDTAFRIAAETLSHKPLIKLSSELFHLHHPLAPEVSHSSPLRQRNEARHQKYVAARWKPDEVRALLDEAAAAVVARDLPPTPIPRIIHRTVPAETTDEVEEFWRKTQALHPGWEFRTYREPLNPKDWPLTGSAWSKCKNGAQKAGLIRLEALVHHGGVYLDGDVEPFRSLEPLLQLQAFAAWEDETTVPDAVLGSVPNHPVFEVMLEEAVALVKRGQDAWTTGPGVTTKHLPGRPDVLVLPPGAFYPAHYLEKSKLGTRTDAPYVFCEHKWHHSWGTDAQKKSIASRQR